MAVHYDALPRSSDDLEDVPFKYNRGRRPCPSILSLLRKARRLFRPLYICLSLLIFLLWQVIFNASYANPPNFTLDPHETVYIAANIVNADLINGAWGSALLELVDLIGRDRVFVSIYGGPTDALKQLEAKLNCEKSIVSEESDPINLEDLPHTKTATGASRIKRIAFLADVRNKALAPLNTLTKTYDRVLFMNDVVFNPMEAARLLWGTNLNEDGKAEYKAVCAVDFIKSWKFYDTFATRDLEGYGVGIPLYPWFTNEGDSVTRNDILAGRDAVRVKSCWGGMVAFDGRYLQRDLKGLGMRAAGNETADRLKTAPTTDAVALPTLPLRFRSEPDALWEASECCLIHADILALPTFPSLSTAEKKAKWGVGIFMNPYVRVSYDSKTLSYLWIVKRFERLFNIPQRIINYYAHMPHFNPRRTEVQGQIIKDRLWTPSGIGNDEPLGEPEFGGEDSTWQGSTVEEREAIASMRGKEFWEGEGHYVGYDRVATVGGYCGLREILVMKEGPLEEGERYWENLRDEVPPLEDGRP